MDRIKLCVITPEFLPVWGGAGTYVVELVRHLPKDIEVHVVTPMREGFGEKKVSTSDYDFSEYFGDNIHVHFVCKATDTFIYNASFQLACLRHVPKLVKKEGIDLIHIGHHMAGLLLELKGLNIPTVTTIHNTIQDQRDGTKMSGMRFWDLEFSEKAIYLTYAFLRLAEIIYFLKPRYYVTISKWMKRQLENNFHIAGSIRVIPSSVDINDYKSTKHDTILESQIPQELRDRRMILYVGRLLAELEKTSFSLSLLVQEIVFPFSISLRK